jgi:membrane fusion protein, multidrug efflux system
MTEETETPPPAGSNRKWALIGLGVVGAVAAGAAISGGTNDLEWSDSAAKENGKAAVTAPPKANVLMPAPAPAIDPASIVRGVINPQNESTIASKMTARIIAMPFREGQSFGRGALLARFDCSQISAELKAAEAASTAYRKTYETNVELDQYNAIGKNEVAVSQANLGKARAEAAAVSTQLSDCAVYAPYSGKVVEQIAHAREIAASGQPLLKIQSGTDVEMELIVPSRWLTWLRPGATFGFAIDETGNSVRGQVTRFGASVDPVSKTIRVKAKMTQSNGLILPGMSGTATFDDPRAANPAAVVTPATAAPAVQPQNGQPQQGQPQQGADGKPS